MLSASPEVAELPGANLAADHGLASLGLVMQLGGTFFAAYSAVLAFLGIVLVGGPEGPRASTLWAFFVLGLGVTRAIFHRAAGSQLLYGVRNPDGEATNAFGGIRRYIIVGTVHAVITGVLLASRLDVDAKLAAAIAAGLLVWPATLAVVIALPKFRRCAIRLPVGEDKGFEGAAILMIMLGLCGAFGSSTLLVALVKQARLDSGAFLFHGPGFLIFLALAMLVVRSLLHVTAGLAGLRETSVDRAALLANRYASFGVISAFAAAGALLLLLMTGGLDVFGLALVAGGCWMLMGWPLIVRRFFSDRQFADLLAGEAAAVHRRAPDAGLSGLGWFLIAHAALGATFLVPQLLVGDAVIPELASLGSLGQQSIAGHLWWNVGLVVFQLWAGMELVRMSRHHKLVATVFGVVGGALGVWLVWPVLGLVAEGGSAIFRDEKLLLAIGPLAMQLVIPIATALIVNRAITPTARATYRRQPPAIVTTP